MFKKLCVLIVVIFVFGCGSGGSDSGTTETAPITSEAPTATPTPPYFPPKDTTEWATTQYATLGWDTGDVDSLLRFVEDQDSRAFLVVKDGKIVIEAYFGTTSQGEPFDGSRMWYWASAGKSLMSSVVGIAQEQQLLSTQDSSATYLGTGWSSLTLSQENDIHIHHHLTMTT